VIFDTLFVFSSVCKVTVYCQGILWILFDWILRNCFWEKCLLFIANVITKLIITNDDNNNNISNNNNNE